MLARTDPVSFSTEVPALIRQQKDGFRCCILAHGNLNRIFCCQFVHTDLLAVHILHRNSICNKDVHLFLSAGFREIVVMVGLSSFLFFFKCAFSSPSVMVSILSQRMVKDH